MLNSLFNLGRNYLRNIFVVQTLLLMTGRGASRLLSFIAFVIIGRELGPDLYGGFNFAFTFASILIFIPNMGADPLYIREVSAGRARSMDLLGVVLILKMLGSVIFLLVYFGGIFLTTKSLPAREASIFIGVSFIVMSITQTWGAVLITSDRVGLMGFLEALQAGLFLLFIVFYFMDSPSSGMAAKCFLIAQVVGSFMGFGAALKVAGIPRVTKNITIYLQIFSQTIPLALIWLVSDLYLRIDMAMLFYLRGEVETGLYGASYRLVEGVYSAAIVVCATALPRLSLGWHHGPTQWKKEWKHMFAMIVVFISIPVLGLTFFSDFIVRFLYGSSFAGAADSLKILGPAAFVLCIGCGYGISLTSVGKERHQLLITLISLASNVGLNIYFIPLLGGVGAALSTLISAIVYLILANSVLGVKAVALFSK